MVSSTALAQHVQVLGFSLVPNKQTIFVNWVVLDRVNKTVMKGKSFLVADMEDLNTTSHTPIDSIKQQERPLQNVSQIMSSLP